MKVIGFIGACGEGETVGHSPHPPRHKRLILMDLLRGSGESAPISRAKALSINNFALWAFIYGQSGEVVFGQLLKIEA